MFRKMVAATALAVLALSTGLVSVAAADRPIKEPLPAGDLTGQFCEDFAVLVHPTTNKEFLLTFSSGRAMFAGTLREELTNLETGKTIAVNASGPATFSSDGATITLKGNTLLVGETGFFGPGSPPRLSLVSGKVVVDLATFVILSETGQSRDLCVRLADS